jgi:membrane-associated phospholipid phosphatase
MARTGSPLPADGWALRAAGGAGLLATAWYALRHPAIQRADVRVGDAVRDLSSPAVDRAVAGTTDLGSVYAVAGIATVLALARRQRTAADVVAVGLAAWSVAQASKTRVRRQRPYEAEGVRRLVRPPTGSSFPSGHAAVGMAVMTVLADRARTRRSGLLLRGLGAYVALSRVYAGVHYPTDVIGGAGMGLALGSVWRGPVAAAGRGAVTGAAAGVSRALRRWRGSPPADAAGLSGPTPAPATAPRRRSPG